MKKCTVITSFRKEQFERDIDEALNVKNLYLLDVQFSVTMAEDHSIPSVPYSRLLYSALVTYLVPESE